MASDYTVVVTFVPRECKVFTINRPTLTTMNVKDYRNYVQTFKDLGMHVDTLGYCGDRSFKLTDSSGVDNALSWIILYKDPAIADGYEIKVESRGAVAATYSLKLRITSILYTHIFEDISF